MLIERESSLLIIVDMQEKLLPAVHCHDKVILRCALVLKVAMRLNVPVLASEHYSKGIGPTHPKLGLLLPPNACMEKIHFSCAADDICSQRIASKARRQILLCGAETHVCVQQTALGLKQSGYDVFVVADATGSRKEEDKRLGLARMSAAGINIVSSEMAVFEWLARADTCEFREILPWIKADGA